MTPRQLVDLAILPALSLLPPKMSSRQAVAMMIAIALQESRIEHRRQIGGPARGFWQFEAGGGVTGVLRHASTGATIRGVLDLLRYDDSVQTSYQAIEHNDILAAVYARLLLWTLPQRLPEVGEPALGWDEYEDAWRPGAPHRQTWDNFYAQAWAGETHV